MATKPFDAISLQGNQSKLSKKSKHLELHPTASQAPVGRCSDYTDYDKNMILMRLLGLVDVHAMAEWKFLFTFAE